MVAMISILKCTLCFISVPMETNISCCLIQVMQQAFSLGRCICEKRHTGFLAYVCYSFWSISSTSCHFFFFTVKPFSFNVKKLYLNLITIIRISGKDLRARYRTFDSSFDCFRSHQQRLRWSPTLEIETVTIKCRAETLPLRYWSTSHISDAKFTRRIRLIGGEIAMTS